MNAIKSVPEERSTELAVTLHDPLESGRALPLILPVMLTLVLAAFVGSGCALLLSEQIVDVLFLFLKI